MFRYAMFLCSVLKKKSTCEEVDKSLKFHIDGSLTVAPESFRLGFNILEVGIKIFPRGLSETKENKTCLAAVKHRNPSSPAYFHYFCCFHVQWKQMKTDWTDWSTKICSAVYTLPGCSRKFNVHFITQMCVLNLHKKTKQIWYKTFPGKFSHKC